MLKAEINGGPFKQLCIEADDDVDPALFAEMVRNAMYFTLNRDPPEIMRARELAKALKGQHEASSK